MDNKKPFSHPRWNDPPKARVIGQHKKFTAEEKKKADHFEEIVLNGDYEKLLKGEIKL
ncbi:MAG: hypothetical protein HFE75_08720 [Firmicutes bacterium]|jgi:hypothetical protein|nr:hypothetical protein [Bacillota bacterium]